LQEIQTGGKKHMATNEPNKPDNVINIDPGNKTQAEEKAAPDQPLRAGGEAPGDVVVSSDKINEIISEKKAAAREAAQTAEKAAPEEKAPEPAKPARRGRPAKAEKADKPEKEPKPEKKPKAEKAAGRGGAGGSANKDAPPAPEPEKPAEPREAPRPDEPDQIVFIKLSELHAFKNHPFGVRDDAEMRSLVESVKEKGVNQPALVRPREDGGYEIIAGHRRQKASELAGFTDMRCIVRNMTDDEAILAMTDDNLRQRSEILPSEKAVSLKMQIEAINHRGSRGQNVHNSDTGKKSIEIVGERNGMTGKQVQRYVRLTALVPDIRKAVDEKKIGFTPAVEISFIKPKHQNMIAVSIDGQQSAPSLSQAKRMRELDQKNMLNGDVIDGILCEEKKEVDRVIISGGELGKYFGKEKTPQQMKEQIIKLLDDWSGKQKELAPPEKKPQMEK